MRLAVVGSREFPRLDFIDKFMLTVPEGTVIVSGGARGVDKRAAQAARKRGFDVFEILADWDGPLGKGAGFARNTDIVDEAALVVAFWDGKSRGTLDTIKKAAHAGKLHKVFNEFGVNITALVRSKYGLPQ